MHGMGWLCCVLASASTDATCCACSPPANPPPPAEVECAGDYGSTVGGNSCCGQVGRISSAFHICPRHAPACSGYRHSLGFGNCVSREEAAAASSAAKLEAEEGGADADAVESADRDDVGEDDGGDYAANYTAPSWHGNWSSPDGGVYNASTGMRLSSHLGKEIEKIVRLLGLRPGMTYCELGCGSGEWVAGVGRAVMPGGKVLVTAPHQHELQDCKVAAKRQGIASC